jgi:hypothetical protein
MMRLLLPLSISSVHDEGESEIMTVELSENARGSKYKIQIQPIK